MENKRKKQTLGRQKIEIKKIETNSNLQVTFSKRRAGLFKKAAELSLLCGSDVAAFVNSPTGKVYAFSNLPVDVLLDRYLNQTAPSSSSSLSSLLPFSGPTGPLHEVAKKKYMEVKTQLEVEEERERRKAAVTMVVAEGGGVGGGGDGFWWDQPTEGLGLQELEQYVAAMEEMKKKVVERAEELAVASASPSNLLISAFITEASTEENSLDFERKFY